MPTQVQIDTQDATALINAGLMAVLAQPSDVSKWDSSLPATFAVIATNTLSAPPAFLAQGYVLLRDAFGNLITRTVQSGQLFRTVASTLPGSFEFQPTPQPPPPPPPTGGGGGPPPPPIGGGDQGGGGGSSSPSSSGGVTLPPLAPVSIPAVAPGQTFSTTVANALGSLGTGADGFDAVFALPALAIDADTAALSDLDAFVEAMDFVEGDFDGINYAGIAQTMLQFLTVGDAFFS